MNFLWRYVIKFVIIGGSALPFAPDFSDKFAG